MKNCKVCGKPVYDGGSYCCSKCQEEDLKKSLEMNKKFYGFLFSPIILAFKLVFKLIGLIFWIICKILALPDKLFFSKKSQKNKGDAEGEE